MKLSRIFTFGLSMGAILLLSGCSVAKGPQFIEFQKPNKDEANLYIYRKIAFWGGRLRPDMHQKNTKTNKDYVLPDLQRGGYIMQTLKPGSYQFWAKTETKNEVNLNVEPNQIYCIQFYTTPGFLLPHPQFELQDLAECELQIKETKLSL